MSTIAEALQEGLDHHRAGRLPEAERMYRRVLDLYPRHARAAHLLGLIAYQAGQNDKAVALLTSAITIDRFNANFHADLGEIYRVLAKYPEAEAACAKAIELKPESAAVHNCLGLVQQAQEKHDEAMASFRQAVTLNPELADARGNLGTALRAAGRLGEAQVEFERAVQLAPDTPAHYLRLGVALYDQGKILDAIACYQKTLRLAPDNTMARYDCALARLALGDYENGWREFEARHSFAALIRRAYSLPMWHPRAPQTGAVLIHAEQGFGDTLQFARYVPMVEQLGATTFFDVHQELASLIRQSGFKNVISDGAVPAECTCQIPLMSLPRVFDTTVETIPAEVPYLSPSDELVARWRDRLAPHPGLKVGIHWQGMAAYYNDRARSIALERFAPLAAVPGVQLVSLQKDVDRQQVADATAGWPWVDLTEHLVDFHESAALVRNLDLVIGCDSAPAHLAGALGVGAWVGLTVGSDWRWMLDRADTPWYPTMRLFRQKSAGDWDGVIAEMATELTELARARNARA